MWRTMPEAGMILLLHTAMLRKGMRPENIRWKPLKKMDIMRYLWMRKIGD